MLSIPFIVAAASFLVQGVLSNPACIQPRGYATANGSAISGFIDNRASNICLQLQAKSALKVQFEGFQLVTSGRPRSLENCTFALSDIAHSCVSNQSYYGGTTTFKDIKYLLNNTLYPWNPIFGQTKYPTGGIANATSYARSTHTRGHSVTAVTNLSSSVAYSQTNSASPLPTAVALQAADNATASLNQFIINPNSTAAGAKAKNSTHEAAAGEFTLILHCSNRLGPRISSC